MAIAHALLAALQPQRIWERCDVLGRLSELDGGLTRVFLSPQQGAANALVLKGEGRPGILASGVAWNYLREALGTALDAYNVLRIGRGIFRIRHFSSKNSEFE